MVVIKSREPWPFEKNCTAMKISPWYGNPGPNRIPFGAQPQSVVKLRKSNEIIVGLLAKHSLCDEKLNPIDIF